MTGRQPFFLNARARKGERWDRHLQPQCDFGLLPAPGRRPRGGASGLFCYFICIKNRTFDVSLVAQARFAESKRRFVEKKQSPFAVPIKIDTSSMSPTRRPAKD
ncbi:hypothetical protein ABE485_11010 [Achromobacter spanius]|uniref:hypothetical protein n=1 Tax=Achromobacter spanius TaxID=217203 RepID=UPI00320946A2